MSSVQVSSCVYMHSKVQKHNGYVCVNKVIPFFIQIVLALQCVRALVI